MENISNRIKYVRESLLRMSQEELAKEIGFSQKTLEPADKAAQ